MSLMPPLNDPNLPKAYGGCQCLCHRQPGVMHCVPCCYLTSNLFEPVINHFCEHYNARDCSDKTCPVHKANCA